MPLQLFASSGSVPDAHPGRKHESLTCEDGGPEIGADGGFEALALERQRGRLSLDEGEGGAPDHGKVAGGVIFAGAALVLAEVHVQEPVQIVLHAPMGAHGGAKRIGSGGRAATR